MTAPHQDLDSDIAQAHAKVKAHQRQSMLAMAAGMLVALPFFLAGLALHYGIMLPGFFLGALVWKKLRPADANPLNQI